MERRARGNVSCCEIVAHATDDRLQRRNLYNDIVGIERCTANRWWNSDSLALGRCRTHHAVGHCHVVEDLVARVGDHNGDDVDVPLLRDQRAAHHQTLRLANVQRSGERSCLL